MQTNSITAEPILQIPQLRPQAWWPFERVAFLALAVFSAITLQPHAATVSWVGGSGDWNAPANWSGGALPGPADDVVIDLPGDLTITHSSGDDAVQSIQCSESFVLSGGSLSVANATQFSANFNLNGGELTGSGDVTATNTFNWTGGTMTGAGKTIIPAGATLTIWGGTLGRELRNHGTATWTYPGYWLHLAGGTINNHGAFTINSVQSMYCDGDGGVNAFNNLPGATLTKVGSATIQFRPNGGTMPLNNSGTVNVEAGTLSLAGGGVNNATINVAGGATLGMEDSYTYAASSALGGSGTFFLHYGTHTFPAGPQVTVGIITLSAATLSFTDPMICSQFNFSGGTLTGSGDVTATNSFSWSGGTMTGTGKTIIPSGATLTMSGGTLGRELRNEGAATWTYPFPGFAILAMAGGTLNNYGSFTINNGQASLYCDGTGGVNAFNNLPGATLTKMGAAQVDFRYNGSAMPLNNSGTVNVQGGTMFIEALGDNRGVLNVVQGTMRVNASDANFQDTGALDSEIGGTFQLYGGGLSGNTTNVSQYAPKGRVLIDGGGARQLEVMSRDLGNVPLGYETNFAYGTLELGGSVNVTLVDASDNSPGSEALYVDNLIVRVGTTLNLSGLNIYVHSAQISGTVTGGTIAQTPTTKGPLTLSSLTPSTLAQGAADEWTFFGRQNQTMIAVVETGGGGVPVPQLGFAEARLLDSLGTVLAQGSNTVAGQPVVLPDVLLPVAGTYRLEIRAPANQPASSGNYRVVVWEVTPDIAPLVLNDTHRGQIETPFSVDRWTFSAVAGQQVRFDLVAASAPGVAFTLRGPSGWVGFSNLVNDSSLVTLPVDGSYTLSAFNSGGAANIAYSFKLDETVQTPLAIGATFNGQFTGDGQGQVFVVNVPSSGPLRITLTGGAGNRTELYAARGGPPTRGAFEFSSASGNDASRNLLIPNAPAGTLYVLVYGDNIPSPGGFSLQVTSAGLFLTDISPAQQANNVSFAMTLTGAGFEAGTTVELLTGGGASAGAAADVAVDSYTQVTATFPPNLALPGVYSIRVQQPDGDSAVLANAFTMLAPGAPRLVTRLIMPGALGRHAVGTIYVEYANEGNAAMPAPLLVLKSNDPDGTTKPILTLDQSRIIQNYWSFGLPPGTANQVFILAGGAQPGVLNAGERFVVPVYYLGLQEPWVDHEVRMEIRYWTTDESAPIDWPARKELLRPPALDTGTWDLVFANLAAALPTTGDYVRMLGDNAQYLSRLGQRVVDVDELWNFEVQQAYGYSAIPVLDSAVDSAVVAPRTALSFGRRFASNVRARNSTGWFGRGWYTPWQARLAIGSGGDIVRLVGDAGAARLFTRDSRNSSYFSGAGDSSSLAEVGSGIYELREPNSITTRFRADGRIDYVQDPNGNRTAATYDGAGRLTGLSHNSGGSITITYNSAGFVDTVANSAGRLMTYSYSGSYLQMVTTDDGKFTSYTYETAGTLAQRHALLSATRGGTVRHFTYDTQGRLASTFLAAGEQLVQFSYDSAGRVSTTDALGTTQMFFDHHGFVAKVMDALGNVTTSEFNTDLRLSRLVLPTGEHQSFTWCNCGSLTSLTDELGHATTFRYDNPFKRLTSFTDARLNTTRYTYDNFGNPLSTIYPDNSVERWGNYTATGLPQSSTNRRGQPISFSYLPTGQVDRQTFADGSYADFDYDPRGYLTNVTEHPITGPDKVTSYLYEPAVTGDRLRKVTYPNARWVEYSYDSFGRRQRMTDSAGGDTRYEYDSASRLWKLRDAANNVLIEYLYTASGRLQRINKGNGTYTTYAYDAAGQLLHMTNSAPGGTVNSRFDYTYDSRGRRITMGTVDGDWAYDYDATGQLIRAQFDSGNGAIADQDLRYIYDAVGNRTLTESNGVQVAYTANNLNEYTTVGGVAFQYDADGNLTSDGIQTFQYDTLSRLIRVTGPEGVTEYEYDALNNRTATVFNGQRIEYLLDPSGFVNVLAEHDGGGVLLARNVEGIGLVSRTQTGGNPSYFDFDAIGSAAGVSGDAGSYVNRYAHLPFGQTLNSSETVANPFRFVGQFGLITDETQLPRTDSRSIHPSLGRFLSLDPLRGGASDVNFYRYGFNNPISLVDYNGLWSFEWSGFAGYVVGGYLGLNAGSGGLTVTVGVGAGYGAGIGFGGSTSSGPGAGATVAVSTPSGWGYGGTIGSGPSLDGSVTHGPGAGFFAGPTWTFCLKGCDGSGGGNSGGAPPAGEGEGGGGGGGAGGGGAGGGGAGPGTGDGSGSGDGSGTGGGGGGAGDGSGGGGGGSGSANSVDPNEKFGAKGAGVRNWVESGALIPYRINFENLGPGSVDGNGNPFPTFATAPAQRVTIDDQLSSNLDWSTFELVELGFGDTIVPVLPDSKHYATSVPMTFSNQSFNVEMEAGINLASGRVFAIFQSVDPETSLPPDVLTGFLPPEDGTGRGKGHLSFLVRARSDLTNGVEIRNVALIQFDHQQTIATDQVDPQNPGAGVSTNKQALNTTDAGVPSSSVAALPVESTSPFVVQWSGSDDPLGSGIASYDVFSATNGSLFGPWILGTNGTAALFIGEVGKTYAFYSIARDAVGFAELPPAAPDAATTVVPSTPPLRPMLSISRTGELITISWPANAGNFMLEYTESLTPPVEWHEVTSGIAENGGIKSYAVTNNPSTPGRLYRLRLP